MKNKMQKTQDEFADLLWGKTLWWRLSQDNGIFELSLSPFMKSRYQLSEVTYMEFLGFIQPSERQVFEAKLQSFWRCEAKQNAINDECLEQILLNLTLNQKKVSWQCQLGYKKTLDGHYIWGLCTEVSELMALEVDLIESNSRLAFREMKIRSEQAEKEQLILQQKYTQQSLFLAMLSHELRSPLIGMTQLIKQTKSLLSDTENLMRNLSLMSITTEQLTFLVNDILTFSQSQHHQLQSKNTYFSLEELLDYVTHLTKSIAKEKNILVTVSNNVNNKCYQGDVLRISQILINLIVNGIKYTQYGGVFVEFIPMKDRLEFKVIDSGVGMSQAKLANIFAPFTQLDSLIAQDYLGSGLGLSVVKLLVDLLQGDISVTSTEGVGTTFTVNLPLMSVACRKVKEKEALPEVPQKMLVSITDKRVLIADDSLINRKVFIQLLEELGLEVDAAENGREAVELFCKKPYDWIFLDVQMPIMNGVDAAQEMRRNFDLPHVCVKKMVALTAAHTEEELKNAGITVNKSVFDEWLLKPISQDQILALVLGCQQQTEGEVEVSKMYQEKGLFCIGEISLPAHLLALLPEFLEGVDEDVSRILECIQQNDDVSLAAQVHRLKGSVMLFGFEVILKELRRIEQAIVEKEIYKVNQGLYNIKQIVKKLKENNV